MISYRAFAKPSVSQALGAVVGFCVTLEDLFRTQKGSDARLLWDLIRLLFSPLQLGVGAVFGLEVQLQLQQAAFFKGRENAMFKVKIQEEVEFKAKETCYLILEPRILCHLDNGDVSPSL